jgi:hypothetical protein
MGLREQRLLLVMILRSVQRHFRENLQPWRLDEWTFGAQMEIWW